MFLFVYYCNISLNHLRFKHLGELTGIEKDERFLIKKFEWEEKRSWNIL